MKFILRLVVSVLGLLALLQVVPGEASYAPPQESVARPAVVVKGICQVDMERNLARLTCRDMLWKTHDSTIAIGFWATRPVRFDEKKAASVVRLAKAYSRISSRCSGLGSCKHQDAALRDLERAIESIGRRYGWYSARP